MKILYVLTAVLAGISACSILFFGISVKTFPILVITFVFAVISTLCVVYDTLKEIIHNGKDKKNTGNA